MKRRTVQSEPTATSSLDFLCEALTTMRTVAEMRAFLRDLTTPAELEALTDRWKVVPYLLQETAYREIHERTAVSVTTIGRVARFLAGDEGGYALAAKRLKRKGHWPSLDSD